MKMRWSLILVLSIVSQICWAYIPSAKLILTKTALNGGQGAYKIEKEVTFFSDGEELSTYESWVVMDGNNIRIQVVGLRKLKDKLNLNILYKDGRRYFIDEEGNRSASSTAPEFLDSLFLFRSRPGLGQALIQMRLASGQILKDRALVKAGKSVEYKAEGLFALARLGQDATLQLADPALNKGVEQPKVWFDQDKFVIQQVQTASGVLLEAQDFKDAGRGLLYPNKKSLRWDGRLAQQQVLKITALGSGFEGKQTFDLSLFDGKKENKLKAVFPENEFIKDFYTRFR